MESMKSEIDLLSKISTVNKIDPTEFDVTICALLTGLGAEKYIDLFRKHNIGQCTLVELTDEDLIKLGIKEPDIRQKILKEVKNLPIYEETNSQLNKKVNPNLGPLEIVEVLEETSQHLYRIYLSMLANTLAVKKTKNIVDSLLCEDKFASDVAIGTWNEVSNIINLMEINMHTKIKNSISEPQTNKYQKVVVGSIGSFAIAVLTVLFIRSLKHIN